MNIDITKTYTTRSGLPVRIYAVDGAGKYPVHGALFDGAWIQHAWAVEGSWAETPHGYDLIPVKTWRAWKEGEGPKRLMIRAKGSPNGSCEVLVREGFSYSNERLFVDFVWLHEDGTTTPCGVLE